MANVDNFEVTFAGVPFRTPTKELVDRLERYSWLPDMRDVLFDNSVWPGPSLQRGGIPNPLPYPHLKIGDFFYPTGASRFGIYRGVMTASDIATVKETVWSSSASHARGRFKMAASVDSFWFPLEQDNFLSSRHGYIETDLYMLPPIPINGQMADEPEAGEDYADLYIVTLVDERYYWHQYISSGSLPIGESGFRGWEVIRDQLATQIGISLTSPAVSTEDLYPEADSPFYSHYESAAAMMDFLCANLNTIFFRRLMPSNGYQYGAWSMMGNGFHYNFQNELTVFNQPQAPTKFPPRLLGGRAFAACGISANADENAGVAVNREQMRAILPQSIRVVFPKWITNSGYYEPGRRRKRFMDDSYGSVYTINIGVNDITNTGYDALPDFYAFSGEKTLKTTAKAKFAASTDATPTNLTDCEALANWLAENWVRSRLIWADEVYRGIIGLGGGIVADMLWRWNDKDCFTRIMPPPLNWGWSEYFHSFDSTPLTQPALSISNGGTGTSSLTTGQVMVGGSSSVDQLTSTRTSGETLECKLTTDRWVGFSSGSY